MLKKCCMSMRIIDKLSGFVQPRRLIVSLLRLLIEKSENLEKHYQVWLYSKHL